MRDDLAERATREIVLADAEADRRKAVLRRLKAELAALGVESVLVGRHLLRLSGTAPWSPSGPVDPELHVLAAGCPCTITTNGGRYLLPGGAERPAADPAGAAARILAAERPGDRGLTVLAQAGGHGRGEPGRVIGAGEGALRQLIDDGLV